MRKTDLESDPDDVPPAPEHPAAAEQPTASEQPPASDQPPAPDQPPASERPLASEHPPVEAGTAADAIELVPRRPEPRILRAWASAELAIASATVVVIFVSVLWQVVSRYLPALNWQGVSELANYSLIVLTFITVGYLIGNNGHIVIQIIDYVAKGRVMTVVRAVSAACTALICGLMVWEAYELIRAYPDRTTAALGIPMWLLYAFPLAGFLSGAVRAIVRIFLAHHPDEFFDAAEAR